MHNSSSAANHDYAANVESLLASAREAYSVGLDVTKHWIFARRVGQRQPSQGWKLHVSATTANAMETLETIIPALAERGATFKVAASAEVLDALNHGKMGPSQVGKFMTIYPADDEDAVETARRLDAVGAELVGPEVPSDRSLRPGSVVHYRYAASGEFTVQNKIGEVVPAMLDPDGAAVPDLRRPYYFVPSWARDPFEQAGLSQPRKPRDPVIADRYLVVSVLYQSARGKVFGAVDTVEPRTCVVKQATRRPLLGDPGREVADLLRTEYDTLRALAGTPGYPEPYDFVTDAENVYLSMEWLQAETLEHKVTTRKVYGAVLPPEVFVRWCAEIVALLAPLHRRGLVYSDLKSPNVLITTDDRFLLIDFELTRPIGHPGRSGMGTRGYVSRNQDAGLPATVQDDIHGLGAVLFFIATGAEPSKAPDRFNLLSRPLAMLNPWYGERLEPVLRRTFGEGAPFESVEHVADEVANALLGAGTSRSSAATLKRPDVPTTLFRDAAISVADHLCSIVEEANGEARWTSRHPLALGVASRDVNTGTAGVAIALADFWARTHDGRVGELLAASARWLMAQPPHLGEPVSGLYVGDCGVAAALLEIGSVLEREEFVAKALDIGREVRSRPYESPDLFNGAAGRLRFHLLCHERTADPDAHAAALEAGTFLVDRLRREPVYGWPIPEGHGDLSNKTYYGFAHGTAGIADALLDLGIVTGERRFLDVVHEAANALVLLAVPAGIDGRALNWPSASGERTPAAAYWCHGAAGIALFLMRAATTGGLADLREPAHRAMHMVMDASHWMQPTRCHGLAGNIDILVEASRLTGSADYLRAANELGTLMLAFARAEGGGLTFPGDDPSIMTPDFMVGASGVMSALLRLADPSRPQPLSLRSARHRSPVV